MLLKVDEFPVHQITQTFAAVEGSDPQWNDGHYICFADQDGKVCFVSTVRLYQNNDVLDGFVCIRHKGKQHNIRLSRRLRPDMDTYGVGPLRLEIIEPMQVVRLVLESNDSGLACDILCHTTALPYEDPIVVTRVDGRLLTERAVYEVLGEIEGWVEVAGERYQLSRATTSLFRNHSWGYQGGRGGPRLYGAPSRHRARPAGLRNWVLFHMPDHGGFYQTFDNTEGRRTISEGAMLFADRSVPVTDVDVTNEFYNGDSLRLKSARFTLTDAEGGKRAYEAEDLGWVYCQGGGYFGGFNDGLGQGVYRGDYHVEGEVWDVSHPTLVVDESGKSFEFPDAWAENFTRLRSGSQTGLAHFEAVVFRPKEH